MQLNQRCSMSNSISPPIASLMMARYLSGSWRLQGAGQGDNKIQGEGREGSTGEEGGGALVRTGGWPCAIPSFLQDAA